MFDHIVIEAGGLTKGSVTRSIQAALDTHSAEGWELVSVAEQVPGSMSVRLYFKRPRAT